VIVGAVHLAQHLVPMVRAAEYMATVVDARSAFAAEERFPGAELIRAWPDQALEELQLDDRTAVVLLTHDPKFDDPSLRVALESEAFYVGALGSRRTHAKRVARLRDAGVPDELLDRIHAPIGLDIAARTPGEIAASIIAEIVQEVRAAQRTGAAPSVASTES
jgi:xanthine dehydrogenase accessory factor